MNIMPTKGELHEISEKFDQVLVQFVKPLQTDITPLKAYKLISDGQKFSYILESVEKNVKEDLFSFVGSNPVAIAEIRNGMMYVKTEMEFLKQKLLEKFEEREGKFVVKNAFDGLRSLHLPEYIPVITNLKFDRQSFVGGLVGCVGYDVVYGCWIKREKKDERHPDAIFMLSMDNLLFDHRNDCVYAVMNRIMENNPSETYNDVERSMREIEDILNRKIDKKIGVPEKTKIQDKKVVFYDNLSKNEFIENVKKAKKHIFDGDIFQVVLSRRYTVKADIDPIETYSMLRSINPSPYMYLLRFDDLAIVGASPETLMSVYGRELTVNPIAGTCPRMGGTEDEKLASELLRDQKERAEHIMLVDLGRNDVRMVCEGGSVVVENLMKIVKYSHVQHLESTVKGKLREECDIFDAMRAVFPAGTLSGAPKIRAMEIIHELEPDSRGIYGGGVGYVSVNGSADFAITIRTLVHNGGTIEIQAGAGIVADSDPEREYEETEQKMKAMLRALEVVI